MKTTSQQVALEVLRLLGLPTKGVISAEIKMRWGRPIWAELEVWCDPKWIDSNSNDATAAYDSRTERRRFRMVEVSCSDDDGICRWSAGQCQESEW